MKEEESREGAAFPSGLEQPEGSFRFSRDALLLAEFAMESALPERTCFADLGTGCGVVALAVLRRRPLWQGVGLEIQSALVEAAERNAVRLGVERRFSVVGGDVADAGCVRRLRACSGGDASPDALPLFDAVLCNPPWRREGAGRVSSSCMRRTALFGTEHTFPDFFSAADRLLKPSAVLMAVSGAERTTDLLAALPRRLRPERLRFVFTRQSAPATFVLLEARKNGRGTLRVERMEC